MFAPPCGGSQRAQIDTSVVGVPGPRRRKRQTPDPLGCAIAGIIADAITAAAAVIAAYVTICGMIYGYPINIVLAAAWFQSYVPEFVVPGAWVGWCAGTCVKKIGTGGSSQ